MIPDKTDNLTWRQYLKLIEAQSEGANFGNYSVETTRLTDEDGNQTGYRVKLIISLYISHKLTYRYSIFDEEIDLDTRDRCISRAKSLAGLRGIAPTSITATNPSEARK